MLFVVPQVNLGYFRIAKRPALFRFLRAVAAVLRQHFVLHRSGAWSTCTYTCAADRGDTHMPNHSFCPHTLLAVLKRRTD